MAASCRRCGCRCSAPSGLANLVGSIGWLVQGVGAAWLMTTLAGTAGHGGPGPVRDPGADPPVRAVRRRPGRPLGPALGAAAWRSCGWRRRRSAWPRSAPPACSTPASLLLFTFLIGTGAALNGPAWQAVVREIVPARRAGGGGDAERDRLQPRPRPRAGGGRCGRRGLRHRGGVPAQRLRRPGAGRRAAVLAPRSCPRTSCRASGWAAPWSPACAMSARPRRCGRS